LSTKETILSLLKQAPDTVFSGAALAEQLHVSRTAIWKAIRELEKSGYTFEHLASGYRYVPSDILAADELASQDIAKENIVIKEETLSTMMDARQAANAGQTTPALFLAESQTAGHGRFGRPYFSPKGQIYMSLLLEPTQTFAQLPQYTLLAAVAVAKAIDEVTNKTSEIKWVNDIYLDGKKVCGILSEATSDIEAGRVKHVIIGMGLNVSIDPKEFPVAIQARATSLFKGEQAPVLRNQLIQLIWKNFFSLLDSLPDQSYMDTYRKKSFVLGKQVSFTIQKQSFTGIAQKITNTGELIVQTDQGEKKLSSGEISLTKIE
jgi:BirA family biotin operon repressor/biotin-[acetyl-CoA-carboxylase] ligase